MTSDYPLYLETRGKQNPRKRWKRRLMRHLYGCQECKSYCYSMWNERKKKWTVPRNYCEECRMNLCPECYIKHDKKHQRERFRQFERKRRWFD